MITESQQKTLSELQEIFSKINSLEAPPSNMMEEIEAEVNKGRALKLKSEAALKAERSKVKAMMENHFASVYKPVIDKFIPELKVRINDDGGLYLSGISYHTFHIKSKIFERKHEDGSKYYEHDGFELDGYHRDNANPGKTTSLPSFDVLFKKFVIDAAKSNEAIYY